MADGEDNQASVSNAEEQAEPQEPINADTEEVTQETTEDEPTGTQEAAEEGTMEDEPTGTQEAAEEGTIEDEPTGTQEAAQEEDPSAEQVESNEAEEAEITEDNTAAGEEAEDKEDHKSDTGDGEEEANEKQEATNRDQDDFVDVDAMVKETDENQIQQKDSEESEENIDVVAELEEQTEGMEAEEPSTGIQEDEELDDKQKKEETKEDKEADHPQEEFIDVEAKVNTEQTEDQQTADGEKETEDIVIVATPTEEDRADTEEQQEAAVEDGDAGDAPDKDVDVADDVQAKEKSPAPEAEADTDQKEDDSKQNEEVPASEPVSREQTGEVQPEETQQPAETTENAVTQEKSDMQESALGVPPSSAEEDVVPPAPHLPSPERSHTNIEGQMSTSALNIVWSFGLNRNVPVLNLSDGVREAIMYPCAHVGIMYDYKSNKQHTLQAHLNPITCSAVSHDKRWLVTGDVGPDAMVNIWDTYTGIPIQTMFDPNAAGGVVAVALTPDSRYLATLSALPVQTLSIWDWTVDGDVPICSADLKPEYGVQNFIYFDPTDIHHVVTNSATQVLFFHWADNAMHYFAPPLTDNDFNKPVGRYSQSIFQIGIARALTATSIGNLVVWDNNKPLSKFMDVSQSADKKPLKIIKVHDKGINVLTTTDEYIVLGDTAGHVKFFDQGLRLIYWYQDFNSGPCTAISFAYMPDFQATPSENSKYPSDATKQAKPFVIRNFVVGTAIAVYGNVTTDGSKFKVIHREHDAAVHALASHPKLPLIAIGSYSGLLKLWNYKTKETVASRIFEKVHIQTIAYDKRGFFIAIGCTNGSVYIVDAVALTDQIAEPYRYARDTITQIAFSHNSMYFATADAGYTVTVFKRQRKEGRNPYIWHGRYRSHYKPIRDLLFDVYLDTNEPKLLSLGEDRMLIEYELNNPGKNHVIPKSEDRIEQFALPQCMCLYPPITKEHFLFTANDEYKLKCYNSTTKMCRKTVLGPTYGSPIIKMMVVPTTGDETSNRLLAYITNDKVGLHLLPASGNPHLAMSLIAHPSGVSNIACSSDGKYLFTAGGPDYAVHMWEINVPALDAQAKLGGADLIPFYGLLEGGRDGEMFAELEDLFYYAQLRHQGINSMETRSIGNRVPISEVPFIMRAMGFYPSEQEIEDMLNEIKYDDFVNSGQYQEDIDLGQFIKLYVNHRPAFGLAPEKLLWAFQTLAESPELGKGGVIERGDLLDILQKNGEHMTEIELAEHLSTLLGYNREGGGCEQEPFDAEEAGNLIAENLPFDINAEIMVNEILGFSLTVDPPPADDSKDVVKSAAGGF